MRRTALAVVACAALAPWAHAEARNGPQDDPSPPYEIQLLAHRFVPDGTVSPADRAAVLGRASALRARGKERVHVLVQLREHPDTPLRKAELRNEGLDLGHYVPGSAWVASLPAPAAEALTRRGDVRYVSPWDVRFKVHPRVVARDFGPWTRDPARPEWVMLFVQIHHDVDLDEGRRAVEEAGGVAMPPVPGLHGMTVWVREAALDALLDLEEVLWVQEGPAPLTPNNDGIRTHTNAGALASAPYALDGTGVRLFVFDGGTVRATHETFNPGTGSRVTVIDSDTAADHPTHVAGTAAGDGSGSTSGRGRGVAPDATVLSAGYQQSGGTMLFWDNAGDIQADYTLARNTYQADLGTNSIGSNTASNNYPCDREGDYDVSGSLLDGIVRGDNASVGSPVIMTWANGNERSGGSPRGRCGAAYVTTAPPSCAKNPIHVGALNSDGGSMTSFSSWGPCDDGRLKPVVSAPGCESGRVSGEAYIYSALSTGDSAYGGSGWCGTSMATPAVGGIVSLLLEDWRARGHGTGNDRPLPALVKALLVHTARDRGQAGPDYIYGYGSVDARALVDTMRAGQGTLGNPAATNWGTDSVTNGAVDTFTVSVPAGTGELKATLAWDDAAAAAFAATALVNDLRLELVAPDATVHRAWVLNPASPHAAATTGDNTRDNQEQVVVANPAAGTWTVRVTGASVPQGPQTYGLVYTATPATFDAAACTPTTAGFEAGNDGFTVSGAARVAAPATGHGSFSLRLGGTASTTHEATRDFAIPAGSGRAELTYWWYMTTQETASGGLGWDYFSMEVRNTAGTVLAVMDSRSDGWRSAAWMQQVKVDLTPWAGQTVRVAFRATNDGSLPTTFYVDDVVLTTCPAPAASDFSVSVSPTARTVQQGTSGTVSVTVASTGSFASAVTLSASGLPSGVTASFSPNPVTPAAGGTVSSTLTLTASGTAATGTFTVTVTGTSGATSRTASLSLTVSAAPAPSFNLSASPGSVSVTQGTSGSTTVTATSVNGFASAVSLSASGLPAGVTASFSPSSVTPPSGGTASSTLTFSASATAATGTSTVTITGTSGTLTRTTTVSLTVNPSGPVTVFADGAESSSTTFVTSATTTSTVWIRQASAPYAGTYRWKAGSSSGGNYGNSADARLTTPTLNLGGATSATLTYAFKHSTESSWDFFEVRISTDGGTNWTNLVRVSGNSASWSAWAPLATVNLNAYAGQTNVKIQFRLTSDGSVTGWGAAVDEVKVVKQ